MMRGAFITQTRMEQNGLKIHLLQKYMNDNDITDKDLKSRHILRGCFRSLGYSRVYTLYHWKSVKYYVQAMGGAKKFRERPLELLCPSTAMALYNIRIQKILKPKKTSFIYMTEFRAKKLYYDLYKNWKVEDDGPSAYRAICCSNYYKIKDKLERKSRREPLDDDRICRLKHFLRHYIGRKVKLMNIRKRKQARNKEIQNQTDAKETREIKIERNDEEENEVNYTESGKFAVKANRIRSKKLNKNRKPSWTCKYKINDLVYAKRDGNIFWPAKVLKICKSKNTIILSFLACDEAKLKINSTEDIKLSEEVNVSLAR